MYFKHGYHCHCTDVIPSNIDEYMAPKIMFSMLKCHIPTMTCMYHFDSNMATEAMQIANLTFHSADISDRRATMILSAN